MPRTYVGSLRPSERTPPSLTGLFDWITSMYKLPDEYVLQHQSMDAYLLLRFLKLITIICFVGCFMTFPVLWPVNATGGGGKQQFDLLNFSNISHQFGRFFAHAIIAWFYMGKWIRICLVDLLTDCLKQHSFSSLSPGNTSSLSTCVRPIRCLLHMPIAFPRALCSSPLSLRTISTSARSARSLGRRK